MNRKTSDRRLMNRRGIIGLATAAIGATAGCVDDIQESIPSDDRPDGEMDPIPTPFEESEDSEQGNIDVSEQAEPFGIDPESLFLDAIEYSDAELVQSEIFSGRRTDEYPDTVIKAGRRIHKKERVNDNIIRTDFVFVFETPDDATAYYNDVITEANDTEHGFIREGEPSYIDVNDVDDAYTWVLNDELDIHEFLEGTDNRHSVHAMMRVGNLLSTIRSHNIAPGDPRDDDYEFHGERRQLGRALRNTAYQWRRDFDEVIEYTNDNPT